jgi:hypothetical protein
MIFSYFAQRKSWLMTIVATFACMLIGSHAQATNYYVSPGGNNAGGLSYKSAWTEMNQINWAVLKTNDVIYIDGGTSGITYRTPLEIPASSPVVQILLPSTKGHNGKITLDGSLSPSPSGILIQGPAQLFPQNSTGFPTAANGYAVTSLPIIVQHWKSCGVVVYNSQATVSNMEIAYNQHGLVYIAPQQNQQTNLYAAMVHDNSYVNVENSFGVGLNAQWCWIYNSAYPQPTAPQIWGFIGRGTSQTFLSDCIIGPGLSYGAQVEASSALSVVGSTFIDATVANINCLANSSASIDHCTSFMTPLNPSGQQHSCISVVSNVAPHRVYVTQSVFYGGAVSVPASAGQLYPQGFQNFQYKITGNTLALNSVQADPQLGDNVETLPNNVSIATLVNSGFWTAVTSPSYNYGVSLWYASSVQQLFPWVIPFSPAPAP